MLSGPVQCLDRYMLTESSASQPVSDLTNQHIHQATYGNVMSVRAALEFGTKVGNAPVQVRLCQEYYPHPVHIAPPPANTIPQPREPFPGTAGRLDTREHLVSSADRQIRGEKNIG